MSHLDEALGALGADAGGETCRVFISRPKPEQASSRESASQSSEPGGDEVKRNNTNTPAALYALWIIFIGRW